MSQSNKSQDIWPVPAKLVAHIVGCSEELVRAVRRGSRSPDTQLGEEITVADMLLSEKKNLLVEQVKQLVKF